MQTTTRSSASSVNVSIEPESLREPSPRTYLDDLPRGVLCFVGDGTIAFRGVNGVVRIHQAPGGEASIEALADREADRIKVLAWVPAGTITLRFG